MIFAREGWNQIEKFIFQTQCRKVEGIVCCVIGCSNKSFSVFNVGQKSTTKSEDLHKLNELNFIDLFGVLYSHTRQASSCTEPTIYCLNFDILIELK